MPQLTNFKTFPEFSKLTLNDREAYEALIKDYPPVADISFRSLITWCNPLNNLGISLLNDNLIIPYWIPGDEYNSGLALVGTNKIDETICTIFDYLREKGEPVRLVNVPYFVLDHVRYPELFNFKEDRDFFEYIIDPHKFYPLENMTGFRRRKVERQLKELEPKGIVVRSLDLGAEDDLRLLLDTADACLGKNINNLGKVERDAMFEAILNARILDIENVCLFVGGELQGFCLYQYSRDGEYAMIAHIKAVHDSLLRYELIACLFSKWFIEKGVRYVNINSDVGLLRLRMFMLTLGPVNFFRKYRVEPA